MGQLERYGLYVLCVVIFLILGVALWGGDPALANTEALNPPASRDLSASASDSRQSASLHVPEQASAASVPKDDAVSRLRRAFSQSSESDAKAHLGTDDGSVSLEPLAGVGNTPIVDPSRGGAPVASASTDYVVKKGDTLEEIAVAHFGAGKQWAWTEIAKANPGLRPTKMQVGDAIKLPPRSVLDKSKAEARPTSTDEYEIKSGDNLESIALAKLGKRTLWREIEAANPGLNAARLLPGTKIKIPAAAGAKTDTKR